MIWILSEQIRLPKIVFSSSREPGEAEHKIFDFVREHDSSGISVLNSEDWDLFLIILLSNKDNFFLYRQYIW